MTILIGDVHGKYGRYEKILEEHRDTIQVGDMGIGFRKYMGWGDDDPYLSNPPYDKMVEGNHRFIRGNHDNPNVCRKHTQWIPDGTIENGVMFIGGALSIDKEYRMEGYSYWNDEELSDEELFKLYEIYKKEKPFAMVTHECPESIAYLLLNNFKSTLRSRTREMFYEMFKVYNPKYWVFGHWHMSFDKEIDGTRFICLAELEVKDVPIFDG